MRIVPIAASVVVLGALLGGITASFDAPRASQQRTAAVVLVNTGTSMSGSNNGNG
jgi:hypothetical protein